MKKLLLNKKLIAILALIIIIALSWGFTCGMIKLITLCFGLNFDWLIATGIWLIMVLIGPLFRGSK